MSATVLLIWKERRYAKLFHLSYDVRVPYGSRHCRDMVQGYELSHGCGVVMIKTLIILLWAVLLSNMLTENTVAGIVLTILILFLSWKGIHHEKSKSS